MPNEYTDNKQYKAFDAVVTACKSIAHSAGYQTQPYVTTAPGDDDLENEKYIIWISPGDPYIELGDVNSGPSWELDQNIEIMGSVAAGRGDVIVELHKLMQDTMTALSGAYTTISTAVSGMSMEFEPIETDRMELLKEGRAGFGLTVVITYRQGATW